LTELSIIISTYNSPRYLSLVLEGIINQIDQNFECIIADDGSTEDTKVIVDRYSKMRKLIYVWQEDRGFRLASIRNKALSVSSGEIIAFIDGDCIPSPYYSYDAKRLFERASSLNIRVYFQGHRVILDKEISDKISNAKEPFSLLWIIRNQKHLSNIQNAFRYFYPIIPHKKLKGVRGCNMLFNRIDLLEVNGFDEEFIGWGHEDRDIVSRLFRVGVKRADARGSLNVYHLYHQEHNRSESYENLRRSEENRPVKAKKGLLQL